jgi:Putative ABC exporter
MHGALLTLMRLQLKGWFRRQFTGGSLRRTIFTSLATVVFLLWFAGAAVGAAVQTPRPTEEVMAIVPFYLTAIALLPLVFGNDDRAIAFTPAEIDFLFAGPFSRRDLVLFKMLKMVLSSLGGGLFFALFLRRYTNSFLLCMVGGSLSLTFVNLLATAVALLREMVEERAFALARRAVMGALAASVAAAVWYVTRTGAPLDQLKHLAETGPVRALLAPSKVFAHLFAARTPGEFGGWAAACVAMIVGAVLAVLALDRGYMEAALAASQRRQVRLTRMRRGLAVPAGASMKEVRLPGLAALGPAGAIVRRQIITAVRTSRALLILFVLAGAYGYFISRYLGRRLDPAGFAALAPGLLILLAMLPQMLRFDFRGDLDSMECLKALPMTAGTIARAELAVPALILSMLGWIIAGVVGASAGVPVATVAMIAMAVLPGTVLVIGLENFVFLILPTRLMAQGAGGVAFSGRRILMLLARLVLICVGGGSVGAVGAAAWAASGSIAITYTACWVMLVLIAAGIVQAVAWAFARFDVSVDMPV